MCEWERLRVSWIRLLFVALLLRFVPPTVEGMEALDPIQSSNRWDIRMVFILTDKPLQGEDHCERFQGR